MTENKLLLICAIIATPFVILLDAWALCYMWQHFVMPTFNVQAIGYAMAIGLSIIPRYVMHYESPKLETNSEKWTSLAKYLLRPPCVVLVAWILTLFM